MKQTPLTSPADVSHLLKRRYKFIFPYPGSENFFEVGEIIEDENVMSFFELDKYPHLFKPLAWYEERTVDEMPEYIRLNQIMVVRVAKHHCMKHDEFQAHDTKYNYPYDICAPATKEEYETYINKTK